LDGRKQSVLATRVKPEHAEALTHEFPHGTFHELARIFEIRRRGTPKSGKVTVVCAGTSDLPVAEEASVTAEALGAKVTRITDVGVAGLHRILKRRADLQDADAVVVIAGMEGALASVVGGLVSAPVVAVPTSIGYGAQLNGIAALLTMINSCASNVAVVNIDNGFGGGYYAALISRKRKASK
jgi:NCAIR mutase (PurE)-related protein